MGRVETDLLREYAVPGMDSDFPRAMTTEERAVLDFLLGTEFPGVEALRGQAVHAEVTGLCECGCPSFGLSVDDSRAVPAETNRKTPIDVEAKSRSQDPYHELLLFTRDGWLDYVELVTYGALTPSTFPPMNLFEAPKQYT